MKRLNCISLSPFWLGAFLLGGAILVRSIYLWEYLNSSFWQALILDPKSYFELAKSLAENGLREIDFLWRPPLYPVFLSWIFKISGTAVNSPIIIQGLILAPLSVGLVYLIAKEINSSTASYYAAIGYSLCGSAIYFSSQLLITTLFVFLVLLSVWLLILSQGKRTLFLVLGALVSGFASLARPTFLGIAPFWLYWVAKSNRPLPKKKLLVKIILFAVAWLIPILPITWHNSRASGKFILISKLGGYNFFIGNNPNADGKSVWSSENILNQMQVPTHDPVKHSQDYLKASWDFISKKPTQSLQLMVKKLYYLCNAYEIPSNSDIKYVVTQTSPWLNILFFFSWGAFFPFALVGLFLGNYDKEKAEPMLFFLIPFSVILILFFINARFRAPLVPFIFIFAANGIHSMIKTPFRKILFWRPAMLILLTSFLVSRTHFFEINSPLDKIPINLRQAKQFYNWEKMNDARRVLNFILNDQPHQGEALVLMGMLYEYEGKNIKAEQFFSQSKQKNTQWQHRIKDKTFHK